MDNLIQQIESGTADIHLFIKENYQTTFDNNQNINCQVIDLFLPTSSPVPILESPEIHTRLIYLDGALSKLNQDSPPELHPISENAEILRSR